MPGVFSVALAIFVAQTPAPTATPGDPAGQSGTRRGTDRLRRYLQRDVATSTRFLDHGVIAAGIAGGVPHLYRLSLGLGVLDHLTLGASATWTPRAPVPVWTPEVAVAFWRGRVFDVGAHYRQTLHRPPTLDEDPSTPAFHERTHWFLGSASVSQWWINAGVDVGVVRAREIDPIAGGSMDLDRPFVIRHRLGGGLHLRMGTRRWGFVAAARWPHVEAELLFDLRFGAFEQRPRGGWAPTRGPRYNRSTY